MLCSSWLGCSGHLIIKEKYVMIDKDATSPGGRRRKYREKRERSAGGQGRTQGYMGRCELGKT